MKARVFVPLCLALPLGACGVTGTGNSARDAISEYGSQAMDEGLVNAEIFVCRAPSVGLVIRRYGKSRETAEAWKTPCQGDADLDIIEAPQS